ncbi:MAG: efflux transporter periplasmic adaptor subunit [Caulobacteraceae bacterium]|nr:efflux transporter periplasmic adaptor subunit [Caulobacteraceae bacterium]
MSPEEIKTPDIHRLKLFAGAAIVLAVAVGAGGLLARAHSTQVNAQWAGAQAVPTVALAKLDHQGASQLSLPGVVQAFQTARIYARVSGYLTNWRQDIGSPVKAGQVLASIDAPELDQQLEQARGDLATAQANQQLAALTAKRWSALLASQAVSQQAVDEKIGDESAKTALASAAQANVRRFEAMEAYKQVFSPFDGIVTARKTDVGSLINAGSTGQELFEVADLHRVRIYVQAPQALSAKLTPGQAATFAVPQLPGRTFTATVVAVSHMLDAASHTMQVELQADNPGGLLAAGSYCQVAFQVGADGAALRIPATALIVTANGDQVAVLGADGRAVLKPVKPGRDLGDSVEIAAGLQPTDRVIDSPPESLRTGDPVRLGAVGSAHKGS